MYPASVSIVTSVTSIPTRIPAFTFPSGVGHLHVHRSKGRPWRNLETVTDTDRVPFQPFSHRRIDVDFHSGIGRSTPKPSHLPPPLTRLQQKRDDGDPFNFADDEYYDDDANEDADVDGGNRLVPADDAEVSEEVIRNVDGGKPTEWAIMKDLLGINIFTYVLAALIALFLGLNQILGPGWLGQQLGFMGTGTFTQISDSLPDSVDLSGAENLL